MQLTFLTLETVTQETALRGEYTVIALSIEMSQTVTMFPAILNLLITMWQKQFTLLKLSFPLKKTCRTFVAERNTEKRPKTTCICVFVRFDRNEENNILIKTTHPTMRLQKTS